MQTPESVPDFSAPWHFSDVVLAVEGHKFHVHRSTLSMWSPVFETMFAANFKERHSPEVPLPGKRAEQIESLLRLIYCGTDVQPITDENRLFLLELAEEYQMARVKQLCTDRLVCEVNQRTCMELYGIADDFNLQSVKERCISQAKYLPVDNLADQEQYGKLNDQTKLKIALARARELENVIREFTSNTTRLSRDITALERKRVLDQSGQSDSGDDASVEEPIFEKYNLSCKCCRRRMKNLSAVSELDYEQFKRHADQLSSLVRSNKLVQSCKFRYEQK